MYNLRINRGTSRRDVAWTNKLMGEMKTEPKEDDGYYTVSKDEDESNKTTDSEDQTDVDHPENQGVARGLEP